jgi:hypothetical protein
MVPKAEIPRSKFQVQSAHKTTFDSGLLIPVYVDEVLPGDTFNLRMTDFARLATPLYPIMDNMYMDSFFFFVPNRLLWTHWVNFMGEQDNPTDSTSFVVPHITSDTGGYLVNSIYDYMGLPTVGQVKAGQSFQHNALHLRAYNLIWNQWFRDENLQTSVVINKGDGPDNPLDYSLLRRGKRHDYFTSALPWPQKGQPVTIPLGSNAPIFQNTGSQMFTNVQAPGAYSANLQAGTDAIATWTTGGVVAGVMGLNSGALYADLSQATAATINQLRTSFQVQKLLERDARGGTRYTEIVRSHFGVISPDARLQRPEYLGGGTTAVNVTPIAQTSATGQTGATTPQGHLASMATAIAHNHGFTQSFTEHGVIIGMVCVRADLSYQQGLHRMWSRQTRYDFYFPAFASLGEQTILNKEIYCDGTSNDNSVFGYQERWAEYRYKPSQITGYFRSTSASTLDPWHLAQRFTTCPTLNSTFISDNPPLSRALAVGTAANGQQFIFDSFFNCTKARPLPMYSVPGLIDHF